MVEQLSAQEAFFTKESLRTADERLTWILHCHITVLKKLTRMY